MIDEMAARELAESLRRAVAADGVAAWTFGDRATEQLCRMMAELLGHAEAGTLTAAQIATLHLRFSRGRPRVAQWVAALRSLLEAQETGKRPEAPRRAPVWRGSYAIDPRRWTLAERDAWQRAYPDYSWDYLVRKWDQTVGSKWEPTR